MPRIFINLEADCLQVNLMSTSAQINQLKYTILKACFSKQRTFHIFRETTNNFYQKFKMFVSKLMKSSSLYSRFVVNQPGSYRVVRCHLSIIIKPADRGRLDRRFTGQSGRRSAGTPVGRAAVLSIVTHDHTITTPWFVSTAPSRLTKLAVGQPWKKVIT